MAKTSVTNQQQHIKTIKYNSRKFWRQNFKVSSGKNNSKKFRLFSYAFVTALVLFLLLLAVFSGNPFSAIGEALTNFFNSINFVGNLDRSVTALVIVALAGTAVAVGFKTGLFNMGVSGQMLFAGSISGLFALSVGSSMPTGLGQITIILFAATFGAVFATISGLLKAFFNIHEVVSTILLNWIAFFFMRLVVQNFVDPSLVINNQYTQVFAEGFLLRIGARSMVPALIILFITVFSVWFLFSKTTLGYKMIMVGKNKDAALASGVNVKRIAVFSMAISGGLAGILASVVYFARDGNLSVSLISQIPGEGFSGVAIALLAFNNPIAIIPVSFLFAILQTILTNTIQVDPIYIDLALGLLMLFSAINIVFDRFQIIRRVRKRFTPEKLKARDRYQNQVELIDLSFYDKLAIITNEYQHEVNKHRAFYFEELKKVQIELSAVESTTNFKLKIKAEKVKLKLKSREIKISQTDAKRIQGDFKSQRFNLIDEHMSKLVALRGDFRNEMKSIKTKGGSK